MKSNMVAQHNFAMVPGQGIPRSSFNRSHGCKTTFNAGQLIPVFVDEALPGDSLNLNMSAFARLATPIAPVMDNLVCDSFFFAVPIRLTWNNWKKFNGEQINPGDSTDYLVPQMVSPAGGYDIGSLSDYFGIPTGIANLSHSSLFHRAYALIWNEWFRDENLQDSIEISKGDGPDLPTAYTLQRRGKRHDYFTSCLPWPQKGDEVSIPLGETATVNRISGTGGWSVYNSGTDTLATQGHNVITGNASSSGFLGTSANVSGGISLDPNGGLEADLTTATAATINALRQAFQVQALYEKDARGGTRYTEIVRSHFGVVSPDARMQRPEYLGGGSSNINIHPIPQQSSTDATSPQGNLAAMGTMSASGHGFTKSFTEHCILIGLVSVRADLNYQQGLNRMFSRRTRWDFYWPTLAQLGEQSVLNKEIYAQGTAADEEVFGYIPRYDEMRFKPSTITGQFRSTSATPLDMWHLAQHFTALPTLSASFIEENPPIERVVAVTDQPHFLFDAYFTYRAARPMPTYGIPGMVNKF